MDKIYFKGLNGIRAIAAIIVLIFHIDLYLPLFNLNPIGYSKDGMAVYGVILFFVLSGYLITFLLLTEKSKFKTINIKYFYIRRILKIWPLYYLAIIISALLIVLGVINVHWSDKSIGLSFALYSLFMSNVAYVMGIGILSFAALWSVGVEEQFYLLWPMLVNRSRNILSTLLLVIFIYLLIKIGLRYFENGILFSFVSHTSIDCMAIGGIAAYIYFKKKHRLLSLVYNPIVQISSLMFLIISILWKPIHIVAILDYEIHSVIYAIIILNVSTNDKSILNLEYGILNFLGKISYGIYVYHLIIICVLSSIFRNTILNAYNDFLIITLINVIIIGLTIGISYLSFIFFENRFLLKKVTFSKIQSNITDNK